jgi:hypothetical protein
MLMKISDVAYFNIQPEHFLEILRKTIKMCHYRDILDTRRVS